jgi:drug/metabolite transporter (DMT)-like permease
MMKKSYMTWTVFLLIALNDGVDTLAQLMMKKGLLATGISSVDLGNIAEFTLRNASSLLVWMGVLVYALSFFIWIVILYKIDLSIAMPAGSLSYVFVPLAATLFLHEHIGLIRWVGIFCIIWGIYFVAQSNRPARQEGVSKT